MGKKTTSKAITKAIPITIGIGDILLMEDDKLAISTIYNNIPRKYGQQS
jgi:hypothetical protein